MNYNGMTIYEISDASMTDEQYNDIMNTEGV